MIEMKATLRKSKTDLKNLKNFTEDHTKEMQDIMTQNNNNNLETLEQFDEKIGSCMKQQFNETRDCFDVKYQEISNKISDYKDLIQVLNESQIEMKSVQTEANR